MVNASNLPYFKAPDPDPQEQGRIIVTLMWKQLQSLVKKKMNCFLI